MFIQLSAGDAHTCGLKLNQQVVCWGMLPSAPAGLYLQISAGSSHTCALTHESAVVCWGDTVHGKCDAPPGYDFVQVAAGNSFSCGLRRNGLPECWGKNHMGQTSPPAGVQMRQISASSTDHACGIAAGDHAEGSILDSDLVCWGRNSFGEAQPQRDGPWRQVTCGHWSTCAIRDEIGAECWGKRSTVLAEEEYDELVVSWDHACGATMDGDMVCWGDADGPEKVPEGFMLA